MRRVEVPSYPVTVFVAASGHALHEIDRECQRYCDEVGLCVTLTRTDYIYTGGSEDGFAIGLINYGRFPSSSEAIFARAETLAERLIANSFCEVQSATIQAPDKTVWLSVRDSDGTASAALCEDIAVPQDCQAQAVRHRQEAVTHRPIRRENNG